MSSLPLPPDGVRTAVASLIDRYRPLPGTLDEMLDPQGGVRSHWLHFLESLAGLGDGEAPRRFASADRYLREAGVFYRVYDSSGGAEQAWPLAHLPLLLRAREWDALSRGLVERAEVLESVLADLYGRQRLIADDLLPASLVAGSGDFLRPMLGALAPNTHHLWLYAVDLGRGPDGRWWVLRDRTQAPSGAGYAIQNRVALARAFPVISRRLNVERLAGFFDGFRSALAGLNRGGEARVGLLSPGIHNETYFEHAYLARYLGLLLVEGGDLTVRNDVAYVRTVNGLRRIDVLWRRLDSAFADPLELNARSHIGVPGLAGAVRAGNLIVANALGSGFPEARAMMSFVPAIARRLLGRDPLLPNIATWWCGQTQARDMVLESLDTMAIASAFRRDMPGRAEFGPVVAGELAASERARLAESIARRGVDYVGQELVRLSTMPVWHEGAIHPRPFILRAFVARTTSGWQVMPGGFCRVSQGSDPRAVSMQRGGRSADVWILADGPVSLKTLLPANDDTSVRRLPALLPSRAADNFFWLGRYLDRADMMLRVLRAFVVRAGEGDDGENPIQPELAAALVDLGAISDEQAGFGAAAVAMSAFGAGAPVGSIPATVHGAFNAAARVRDRLSPDGWSALRDLDAQVGVPLPPATPEAEIVDRINAGLRLIAAFSGLAQENMTRHTAWRFLELGRRIERAIGSTQLVQRFSSRDAPSIALDVLLELLDSSITYRQRYSIAAARVPVVDLVTLDPNNPRSIAFQAERVVEHLHALPDYRPGDLPGEAERGAMRLAADLATARASRVDATTLRRIESGFLELAEALARTYFTDRALRARDTDLL